MYLIRIQFSRVFLSHREIIYIRIIRQYLIILIKTNCRPVYIIIKITKIII